MNDKVRIRSAIVLSAYAAALAATVPATEPATLRAFALPGGLRIEVPSDWTFSNEESIRAFEVARDAILEEGGVRPIDPNRKSTTPFLASKKEGGHMSSVIVSLGPGEATQAEVEAWPGNAILRLGELLGDKQIEALTAAGCTEIA